MHRIVGIVLAFLTLFATQASAAFCQLDVVSFSNSTFDTEQNAQNECVRLLGLLHDIKTQDCTVHEFIDQNDNLVFQVQLRLDNPVVGLNLQQTLPQLQALIQGGSLLADKALGLQIENNGACQ